jgi:hypothetical protein
MEALSTSSSRKREVAASMAWLFEWKQRVVHLRVKFIQSKGSAV